MDKEEIVQQVEESHEEAKSWFAKNKVFLARFVAWLSLSTIAPILFILFRFDIFHKEPQIAIGFWGLVVIAIILIFIISTLKYVCKALPFSMGAQCISGFAKIILPLALVLFAAYKIRDDLNVFIQALWVVLICEAAAIPVNPMPKWIHEHLSEEQQKRVSGIIDLALDKFFSRKDAE